TFHELNEAFPSLLDENGERKPFERFLNDVQKIDSTYNRAYLNAEYNHAQAAAEMAAKWESFEEDGDDYYLQYRTAGDDKVRPEHAALHGVTLPMSDPFWDEYYPPNGWNCRCTVVQVLKDKYPATDRVEALRRGQEALANDTKGIFHFNPGKQEKTFPDYNPYTLSQCNTCSRKLELAANLAPNQLCQACLKIRAMAKKEAHTPLSDLERKEIRKSTDEWAERHLPETTLPNGQKAKRLIVENAGNMLVVNKGFISKTFSQNARYELLAETMELATMVGDWLPTATLVGVEAGHHHKCNFLVYEASFRGLTIQCKVKDQVEKMVYTMRIIQQKD
ncbi:MAG: minor capsid protein, partial [Bacteroidales bacterium]|nr:minor capsid protein [Bacteroidales bacterium]